MLNRKLVLFLMVAMLIATPITAIGGQLAVSNDEMAEFNNSSPGRRVTVTIPAFAVTLQHLEENNSNYLRWPFLVYNDITYFPMTYSNSNLLNLNTSWTAEGGLIVEKGDPKTPKNIGVPGELSELMGTTNNRRQTATIVNAKVTVNGKEIDNQNEPYPLLFFRDITYFPLTWRFAVDEFGWAYSFNSEDGLNIVADNLFFTHQYDAIGGGRTVYIDNELKITLTADSNRLGPIPLNLSIIRNGVEIRPSGSFDLVYFGYFQEFGPHFTVEGNYIHTTFYTDPDARNPQPVRININTGVIYF